MSKLVLLDSRLFVGGVDLSGSGNKIEVSEEWEAKKTTNWRSGGAEEVIAGLGKVEAMATGMWEAGSPAAIDDAVWANKRTIEPWSFGPTGASDTAAGNLMYLTSMLRTKAAFFGAVGDIADYEIAAAGNRNLVRGQSAHPSGVARSVSAVGTAIQLGALSSAQALYANLHVLSISGTSTPSIAVNIQSDDNGSFTTPVTAGTFTTRTTVGGQALRVQGPFTDDWFRAGWTITGVTPSFLFLVTLGVDT